MEKTLVALFCLLVSLPAAAGGYVVGNGGDGYDVDGTLELTDLLEAGLESTTIPADAPMDARLARLLDASDLPEGFPRDGLVRKLTEFDRASPGLADALIVAMRAYRWRLLRVPLGRLPDREGRTIGLPESTRVQIANRLGGEIRIHRASWNRLSETGRVALLLHETYYSLMRPQPVSSAEPDQLFQSARRTRELVGLSFTEGAADRLRTRAFDWLDIPAELEMRPTILFPTWSFLLLSDGGAVRRFFFTFDGTANAAALSRFVANVCTDAIAESAPNRVLEGFLDRAVLSTFVDTYTSPFGMQESLGITIRGVKAFRSSFVPTTANRCRRSLNLIVDELKKTLLLRAN